MCVPPGAEPGDVADAALVAVVIAPDGAASLRVVQGDAGVFVNGVPVGREPAPLLHGDRVAIDGCELRFADEQQGGVTLEVPTQGDVRVATPSAGIGEARSRGRLVSLNRLTRVSSEASRKIRRGCTPGRFRSCRYVLGNCASWAPSRTSTTTAALAMPEPARRVRSASVGMSATGRLSTQ